MNRIDNDEFYVSNDTSDLLYDRYSEFKNFKAEDYKINELKSNYEEHSDISEMNLNNKKIEQISSKSTIDESKLNEIDSSSNVGTTDTSIVSTTSTTTSTAVTTGATITTTAVGVISFIAITTGIPFDYSSHIKVDCGSDYAILQVDVDSLKENKVSINGGYSIIVDFENETSEIVLDDEHDKYLVANLEKNKTYNYRLVLNEYLDGGMSSQEVLYQSSFTTLSDSDIKCLYDYSNNFITYDYDTLSAYISYSIYFSNYNVDIDGLTFYITNSPIEDIYDIKNVVYSSETIVDNFFKGKSGIIVDDEVYLYVIGYVDSELKQFFYHKLDMNLPSGFDSDKVMRFNADTTLTSESIETINIKNECSFINDSYEIYYYMIQYNESGSVLKEDNDLLYIDYANMSYEIDVSTKYSVKQYKYGFYYYDGSNKVVFYESELIDYNTSQEYFATFENTSLENCQLTYYSDRIDILVDPQFETTYNGIYTYKVTLYKVNGDSGDVIITEYEGIDSVTLAVYDLESGSYYLKYEEKSLINGEEITYQEYITDSVELSNPKVTLSDVYTHDGTHFNIDYTCDMLYDYALASMDITITSGGVSHIQTITELKASDTIVLDFDGEKENAVVTAKLKFKDNQVSQLDNMITSDEYLYNFVYSFSVTNLMANMYDNFGSSTTAPITMKFDYSMPSTYQLNISDSTSAINDTIGITDKYSFNTLAKEVDSVLTIKVLDENGSQWGEDITYTISYNDASAAYVSPSCNAPNPGDVVLTYNDDGTINMYRKVNFVANVENSYYNARVYSLSENADGSPKYEYDIITTGAYANIENIPGDEIYVLDYYRMFDYNGVSYAMYIETPSGSVEVPSSAGPVTVSQLTNTTVLTYTRSSGYIANKIEILGTIYEFDNYSDYVADPSLNSFTVTLDGLVDITSVKIYYSDFHVEYDSFKSEIELKGNECKEYIVNVETVLG